MYYSIWIQYNKSSISTSACFLLPATEKSNSSKFTKRCDIHPSCKNSVALCKMASMKKVVKYRWWQRNGCGGRSVIKILITTIQVNFVPNASKAGMRQHKFTWIVVIKIFVTDLPLQPFLGCHLYFTTFFIQAILHRATPFFTARVDKHSSWDYVSHYLIVIDIMV